MTDVKETFQAVCDACGKYPDDSILSVNAPQAQALVGNLNLIREWLREKFGNFQGSAIDVVISQGAGYFPRVPWICLLPPKQQVSDGIYVGICFGKGGNGAVVGCMQSVTAPKGLKTEQRLINGKPPTINVDGAKPNTRYNNAFCNPLEVFSESFDEGILSNHIANSLKVAIDSVKGLVVPPNDKVIHDLNIILFGPPGTGKTYDTMRRAVNICDNDVPKDPMEIAARYQQLREEQRIEFVTFHQSYGYEEFIEGIRPVTDQNYSNKTDGAAAIQNSAAAVRYECQDGILKLICALARSKRTKQASDVGVDFEQATIWKMSLGDSQDSEDAFVYDECISNNYLLLGYGQGIDFGNCKSREEIIARLRSVVPDMPTTDYNVQSVDYLVRQMAVGDLVVIPDGNHKLRAIGRVNGPYKFIDRTSYQQMRPVEWLAVFDQSLPNQTIYNKSFAQMTLYRLGKKELKLGALKDLVAKNENGPRNHVLIIDEINRGNISKILGELITLLEPDKRLGAENELTVKLPYSREDFGMPSNLYIIGTMNTADRSIAFLDVALRRRFRFRELMPDPGLIRTLTGKNGVVDGVDVAQLLVTINERIELLYDRDHQIGHAFLLKITSLIELRDAFCGKVIPLLQEYFYGDWTKVCLVLGCPFDELGNGANQVPIIQPRLLSAEKLVGTVVEFIEDKVQCSINRDFELATAPEILLPFFNGIFGVAKAT